MPAFVYPLTPTMPGLTNYEINYPPRTLPINFTPNGATTLQVSANVNFPNSEYAAIQLNYQCSTPGISSALIISGSVEGTTFARLVNIPTLAATTTLPNGATAFSGTGTLLIPIGVIPTPWMQFALSAPTPAPGTLIATAYVYADASCTQDVGS